MTSPSSRIVAKSTSFNGGADVAKIGKPPMSKANTLSGVMPVGEPLDPAAKLHQCAAKGDLATIKDLLQNPKLSTDQRQALVEHRDLANYQRTALIQAARNGHLLVVEYLAKEMKADLFARDSHELNSMAIHFAAELGRLEVVRLLTALNPDLVEAKDKYGATPLNLAAFAGHLKVVQFLVNDKNAQLENQGTFNRTPLLSACEQGHHQVVEFLHQKGANLMAKSSDESNDDMAIHLAAFLGHIRVVEVLLDLIPDMLEVKNKSGETALNRAAMGGQLKIVVFLVDVKKANMENPGEFARTPLMQAADEGHLQIVEFLAERGANLMAHDDQAEDTCLHLATYFNHPKIVAYLIDKGGEKLCSVLNKEGLTAMALARQQGNAAMLEIFQMKAVKA